jgi:hypothetical protein
VDRVLRHGDPAVDQDVGIGEISHRTGIVMKDGRAEKEQLAAVDGHGQAREMTGVGMEQPVGSARSDAHLAIAVENDEGIALLEGAARTRGGPAVDDIERALLGASFFKRHQL